MAEEITAQQVAQVLFDLIKEHGELSRVETVEMVEGHFGHERLLSLGLLYEDERTGNTRYSRAVTAAYRKLHKGTITWTNESNDQGFWTCIFYRDVDLTEMTNEELIARESTLMQEPGADDIAEELRKEAALVPDVDWSWLSNEPRAPPSPGEKRESVRRHQLKHALRAISDERERRQNRVLPDWLGEVPVIPMEEFPLIDMEEFALIDTEEYPLIDTGEDPE